MAGRMTGTMTGTVPEEASGRPRVAPRVAWVDYARGFCIVMVVLLHTTFGIEKATGGTTWLHAVIDVTHPFRMPDFFLISGLFLGRSLGQPWRAYLDRKGVHFLYFYALWALIGWALKALGPALVHGDPSAAWGPLRGLVWDPPGALWFIYLLPIFLILARLLRPVPPWVQLLLAAAIEVAIQARPEAVSWYIGSQFCQFFVFFLVGLHAPGPVLGLVEAVRRHPGAAMLGLLAWGLADGTLVAGGWSAEPGVGLVLGVAGGLAVATLATLLARFDPLPWLAYAGEHSLAVYLAFFLPMASLRVGLLHLGWQRLGWPFDLNALSLLITAASILVPLALERMVRGTALGFLFRRPAWAVTAPRRNGPAPRGPAGRLVAAE